MSEYMIFSAVLWVPLWIILPTLLVTLFAWTLVRQHKRFVGILVGIGLIAALMVWLWLYGTLEVEQCTQACSGGAPLEACRFSCNLESSWPFIYIGEFLLLCDMLVFTIASNHLARRFKYHLNLPKSA
jgi:hypothetical protein